MCSIETFATAVQNYKSALALISNDSERSDSLRISEQRGAMISNRPVLSAGVRPNLFLLGAPPAASRFFSRSLLLTSIIIFLFAAGDDLFSGPLLFLCGLVQQGIAMQVMDGM